MSKRYREFDYAALRDFEIFYYAPNCKHDLVSGVPVFPITQTVSDCVQKAFAHGGGNYTKAAGAATFREAVLRSLEREGVRGRSVMAAAGCTGGLLIAMMTLLEADDEVLVFDPDYAGFAFLARLLGANVRACPLDDDFRIDLDALRKNFTARTKLIAFSNPSNPLGLVVPPETLRDVITIAADHGAWVVCDEVYADFAQGTRFVCAATLGENAIAVRSLSKSAGLAGWRIGYCVGSEDVVSRMCDVQEWALICAPVVSQHLAAAVLNQNAVDTSMFAERRVEICTLLRQAGIPFVEPEAGFFVYVGAPFGGVKFTRTCIENGVAILPGTMFSARDTHVRIAFAGGWTRMLEAVNAFTRVYEQARE